APRGPPGVQPTARRAGAGVASLTERGLHSGDIACGRLGARLRAAGIGTRRQRLKFRAARGAPEALARIEYCTSTYPHERARCRAPAPRRQAVGAPPVVSSLCITKARLARAAGPWRIPLRPLCRIRTGNCG